MHPLLVDALRLEFESSAYSVIELLPSLLAAVLFVAVGIYAGRKIQPVVNDASQQAGLDDHVRETPFGTLVPDDTAAVSRVVAVLGKYYVVLLAVFGAGSQLELQFVTTWSEYLLITVPSVLIGITILVVGVFVADAVGDIVHQSGPVQSSGYASLIAGATTALVYFVAAVIGLDMMGLNVAILYTFGQAFAFGAGLAVALAIGIAFGLGGKEYVEANADDWFDGAEKSTADPTPAADD
ncbi:hypothetical protein C483_07082 [Natrialba hulunbeirensis JCM 10989]|uniref:TM helix repeat-containing protein n=1 Tax=Natrialba hulunbeirensis JCM 10989 TaxID=1227493 RepID=M0A319_9EURY|nr:hypothetical protein [Natrialba hulunbeirensis]ELY92711.1 hypothetical protein C483_07082 [Natrialba hulunbeirensis JCM 10989]